MSELKAKYAYTIEEIEVLCGCAEGDEFYLKSDADDVIAKLKQKINESQTELELWRDGSIISEAHQKEIDEIRHRKYKHCLAMAKWCESEDKRIEAAAPLYDIDKECWEFVSDYWKKWHERWLKIAERFK